MGKHLGTRAATRHGPHTPGSVSAAPTGGHKPLAEAEIYKRFFAAGGNAMKPTSAGPASFALAFSPVAEKASAAVTDDGMSMQEEPLAEGAIDADTTTDIATDNVYNSTTTAPGSPGSIANSFGSEMDEDEHDSTTAAAAAGKTSATYVSARPSCVCVQRPSSVLCPI